MVERQTSSSVLPTGNELAVALFLTETIESWRLSEPYSRAPRNSRILALSGAVGFHVPPPGDHYPTTSHRTRSERALGRLPTVCHLGNIPRTVFYDRKEFRCGSGFVFAPEKTHLYLLSLAPAWGSTRYGRPQRDNSIATRLSGFPPSTTCYSAAATSSRTTIFEI